MAKASQLKKLMAKPPIEGTVAKIMKKLSVDARQTIQEQSMIPKPSNNQDWRCNEERDWYTRDQQRAWDSQRRGETQRDW